MLVVVDSRGLTVTVDFVTYEEDVVASLATVAWSVELGEVRRVEKVVDNGWEFPAVDTEAVVVGVEVSVDGFGRLTSASSR
jgi:hypothetical protein